MSEGIQKRNFPWEDFHGPNLGYVMEQYDQYKIDPNSIDIELKEIFEKWGSPSIQTNQGSITSDNETISADKMTKIAEAVNLVTKIRSHGHLNASIYPFEDCSGRNEFLRLEEYNLSEEDLKDIPAHLLCKDAPAHVTNGLEAYQYLKEVYKKSIAFEFSHVQNYEEKLWLLQMVESGTIFKDLSQEKRSSILKRLTAVEGFEQFLHRTFVGQKRFSIEGLDMLVPILDELISSAVQFGTDTINIGMAHRGRLNVLAHVLGKPYEIIFSEFQHAPNKELVPSEGSTGINYGWSGDVKYHLGANKQIKDENTVRAKVTLANNPSHLEFVDPIVEGYTRAAQEDRSKNGYPQQDVSKAMAILIHGDAAFPGEGIVAETLNLNKLNGYQTGGTIHIIANNMIGFTTESQDSRSTKYASDLAKGYEIPIVHVNADDPEACLAAVQIAMEYRNKFKSDFLIDLIGYRRFGHNEMDEPAMTQPKLYEKVRKHPTVSKIYGGKLVNEGVLKPEDIEKINKDVKETLEKAYQKVPDKKVPQIHEIKLPKFVNSGLPELNTAVDKAQLLKLNEELVKWPEDFNVFPKLQKILDKRAKALSEEGKVEWALGETLAFASILEDGTAIRLSGQDSQRGTFAHRHLVLHDVENGNSYLPLHRLGNAKASFTVHNSPLSEGSVLGFEYGYNVFAPETLVLWEAQYGDFANAAQVFFDQFIAAGRAKWGQKSGLIMLLPHGFEGQGPEHSSGRLERYLQLAAEDSWQVANLTSAAQYFHILRRQADLLKREEVRPLVIMTPKSLLRNPKTVSSINELSEGEFKPVIEQPGLGNAPEKVKRLVLCSGKIAIDLEDKLHSLEGNQDWVHILRVEELYPFPKEIISSIIKRLPSLEEIYWVQEEPQNMGAWLFIDPRLREIAPEGVPVRYIGRRRRQSPAEGDPTIHKKTQERIVTSALTENVLDQSFVELK
ncbi:2-oxoglutarate dehydrogenase E1 component [Metabacillus sediminilitoris]|uniref:2-oxoglutarate dehydrogenase E1 component n=1 Tax=Metabacillus sediminilitoris TaxID=2567941 RepID=A0A4S4BKQ1_9BACI|nr:2-oxoglutarate dehydrogenase E1 component [Metabacillus sediminilitoris]QGQ46544.1 2-oxoglutarate dehydrogenase E1 component [Metabacillus sediminilitoris]THF75311.1 2-oxoglutarate dehydrogenase E1 component [Metabacillus sediminilitoris]